MKPSFLILLPAFLLAACASKTPPVVTVRPQPEGQTLNRSQARGVRHAEVVKAYPLGRYVDPHSRRVMHEAHTVYRVEATPQWNLAKAGRSPSIPRHASSSAEPTRSELLVELNRQREATKAVTQSGEAVSAKLSELGSALQQNRVLAEQNTAMRRELQATQQRLQAIERQLLERPLSTPEAVPDTEDDPW